ncbi:hypothetical protein ERICI_02473 [Paenibacillus larvae subsp. larvae]|uniref:Uncharacterized protein n=1 Tax=Paenibacillus larvae subsp. larvae TaxID=147375 RepID=A0A6C0QSR3_9BACL|nr:hypothetical protein BXP28_04800 [Paenibacillus larvae subsp. larvae]AVF22311.1 hypothetical protein ERICI_02473 [Paenibacillus larvae subsp. larvae]ETK26845.1 hypothetical protein ERIC1_1c02780 [Paenibacillus larvae subsp. larvae DSM 25719]QHZ51744.1 hypothetical protein ERICV_02622 [Paenibacillus larvae subsp. larvae]
MKIEPTRQVKLIYFVVCPLAFSFSFVLYHFIFNKQTNWIDVLGVTASFYVCMIAIYFITRKKIVNDIEKLKK